MFFLIHFFFIFWQYNFYNFFNARQEQRRIAVAMFKRPYS